MSLIKITVTLAPFATGGAIGALFAFPELDVKTKFWLRVVVALGSIATVLGIVVMGSEIIDWFFESQGKIGKLVELFQGLPAEAQRALVATVVSTIIFGTVYVVYRLPHWRPVVVIAVGILVATGATYAITEYIQTQQAREYVELGKKQLTAGNTEAALAAFQRSVELHPTVEAYSSKALILHDIGLYTESIAAYTKAINLEPNAILYRLRSRVERHTDLIAAISDLTKVIELNPLADDYHMRGYLLQAVSDLDKSIADYTKAIELDPNNMVYYMERAGVHQSRRHWTEAVSDYSKVIESGQAGGCTYLFRGEMYLKLHKLGDAISDFKREAHMDTRGCAESAKNKLKILHIRINP